MQKRYIQKCPSTQKEIFNLLCNNDLNQITSYFVNPNQYLRRIAALFYCNLLFNNEPIKQEYAQRLKIFSNNGRICFNFIGQVVDQFPSLTQECIQLMKRERKKTRKMIFCWGINLKNKKLILEDYEYKKYSPFTFLDPLYTVFGIYFDSQTQKEMKISEKNETVLQNKDINKVSVPILRFRADSLKSQPQKENKQTKKEKQKVLVCKFKVSSFAEESKVLSLIEQVSESKKKKMTLNQFKSGRIKTRNSLHETIWTTRTGKKEK